MSSHLRILVYFRNQLVWISQYASGWKIPGLPHLWRSYISISLSQGLDHKYISVLGAKMGVISGFEMHKQLRHVHSSFEERIRILPKVESRSNPRDGVRDHWWLPGDSVSVVCHSDDDEQQNAGCDYRGFLPQLEGHF